MEKLYYNSRNQIEVEEIIAWIKQNHIFSYVLENLSLINCRLFPNLKNHGLDHAFKVGLISMVIASYYDLDAPERKILLDAALLHDIGRIDDSYSYNHNYIGKILTEYIVAGQEFYRYQEHLKLLCALIYGHTMNICDMTIFINSHLEENTRYLNLLKILKDADILDSKRFAITRIDKANFNLSVSESLFDFAEYLNTSDWPLKIVEKSELDGISGHYFGNN